MSKNTRNITKECLQSIDDAPRPRAGELLQVRMGKVARLVNEPSGIFKTALDGKVFIGATGVVGDEHVYPVHGGHDRALHQYASAHYADWRCEEDAPKPELFQFGGFGENIVATNMNEDNVCIGDVFQIGREVLVEVSEPRSPCYKLNLRFQWPRALKRVQRTARTGWNMRVLRTGYVERGDMIQLKQRPYPKWSCLNVKRVIQAKEVPLALVEELTRLPPLTEMVRAYAITRLEQTAKRYKLIDVVPITARVKQFIFQLDEGAITLAKPTFASFAFAQIEFGPHIKRSYSIVSGDLNRFSLGVALDDHSRGGSAYLHAQMRVGDTITMAPGGSAKDAEEEQKCVTENLVKRRIVIIGGIGVTSFLPLLGEWEQRGLEYHVHFAVRSASEAPFLAQIPPANVTVYAKADGRRLNIDDVIPTADESCKVYCCGPTGLMNAVEARVMALGYADHMRHFESFSADGGATAAQGEPFEVDVREVESGRKETLHVPSDKTLLTVLREADFDMTYFCQAGGCGACKVTVCAGKVEHKGTALYDAEKKSAMLSCVSRGVGRIEIELD